MTCVMSCAALAANSKASMHQHTPTDGCTQVATETAAASFAVSIPNKKAAPSSLAYTTIGGAAALHLLVMYSVKNNGQGMTNDACSL